MEGKIKSCQGGVCMTYEASSVAAYVVNYCIDQGKPVTNLKLQKLLYYIQAAFLVKNDKPIFFDSISPWKYGPVVEDVYFQYRKYVDREITEKITDVDDMYTHPDTNIYEIISEPDQKLINTVINSYMSYSGFDLVDKTHKEKPWKEANRRKSDIIEQEDIKEYYSLNAGLLYG